MSPHLSATASASAMSQVIPFPSEVERIRRALHKAQPPKYARVRYLKYYGRLIQDSADATRPFDGPEAA